MFGKKSRSAKQRAESVFDIIDNYPEPSGVKEWLPVTLGEFYEDKVVMGQFATALLAMFDHRDVLREFEKLYFPQEPDLVWLGQVKQQMAELNDLVTSKNQQMTWSINWFAEIKVNQSNPVTLALFATYWIDLFLLLRKTLK